MNFKFTSPVGLYVYVPGPLEANYCVVMKKFHLQRHGQSGIDIIDIPSITDTDGWQLYIKYVPILLFRFDQSNEQIRPIVITTIYMCNGWAWRDDIATCLNASTVLNTVTSNEL